MKSKINPIPLFRKVRVSPWNNDAMDILIHVNGLELTDELREAVRRKIGRARQYAPRALRARVQLHRLHPNPAAPQYKAQVRYEVPGNDLVAEHCAHDPTAALDLVAEKIERRLRRRKTARLARRVRAQRAEAHRLHVG
ncbi:MAG TPA: ribosome-associated translation inhibitor RaiA [Verrucomicrobiae bacterium]|jgi:ribosomal subunit interface protein|nr:ribosome-associated translation inhibitor RaiA [Verrucomicrobiae bacterium]